MYLADLVWLGIGIGLGVGGCRLLQRSTSNPEPTPQQPSQSNEQALHEQLKQLKLAYQMATEMSQFKGGFLARTSHELRSPLNGLIGMQQLILSDLCDDPAEEREFVAQANTSALKMIKVLDSILDVAKAEHGTAKMEIQPIALAELLQQVQDVVYLQAVDRNLRLEVQLPEPDLYVLADPLRLKQVLVKLIDSSISQMSEGKITVSVHPVVESGCVYIWVDDQRPANAHSEPIDLLQTDTTDALPSPGMNLITAQLLLQLMQGRLEIVSTDSAPDTASQETDLSLTRIQCSIPLLMPEDD